jgi:NAD(P)-dependent dehydrogenase (short-subunit alcohol dehydrogenase family)
MRILYLPPTAQGREPVETLDGRTVVVIGGSSGMGLATATAARDAGAHVVIAARDADRLARAEAVVGDGTRSFALDGADAAAVEAMCAGLGSIDHVVSFAGDQPAAPIGETTHDFLVQALDARVWTARNVCVSAVPRMPEHGSLTFCSGLSAVRPRAGRAAGALATAALESLVRTMALELAPIRVNTVRPGAFDTPVLDRAFGTAKYEATRPFVDGLPIKRLGRPEELAHAVLFLMTNSYVTGTVLNVDGGALM